MPLTKATTNVVNLDKDTLINGIRVGSGQGNIVTNTCVGLNALSVNTTGMQNAAIGAEALSANVIGKQNTAVGNASLRYNTTGDANTALGNAALVSNTGGFQNTAVGHSALYSNQIGIQNTAVGALALYSNTTGDNNTALGASALNANLGGFQNTAVGHQSLFVNTNGFQNTAVGINSLISNTTGDANTAIGVEALNTISTFDNCTGLGHTAQVTGANQVQVGNAATTTYAYGAVQDRSDIRDKADVRDTELGLEFVNALRPVDFKWDMREDYRPVAPVAPSPEATDEEKAAYKIAQDKWLEDVKLANITHDGSKKRNRFHHGLIAQEVKAVLDAKGIDFGGFQDHSVKGGDDVLSIGYVELIAPMLKAIQELSAKVAELEAK
jgi:hypothetical protein